MERSVCGKISGNSCGGVFVFCNKIAGMKKPDRLLVFEIVAELTAVAAGVAVGWIVAEASALGIGLIAAWATVSLTRDRIATAVFAALRAQFPS